MGKRVTHTKTAKRSAKKTRKAHTRAGASKKIGSAAPVKIGYSQKDMEYFKQLIIERKKEMFEELSSLNERMLDTTTGEYSSDNSLYSLHMAEQGTDAMEREKTFLLAQRGDDHIKRLDESLARIADGSYGVCVVCGQLIEKERLEIVPTTNKHVNCKNRIKRQEQQFQVIQEEEQQ